MFSIASSSNLLIPSIWLPFSLLAPGTVLCTESPNFLHQPYDSFRPLATKQFLIIQLIYGPLPNSTSLMLKAHISFQPSRYGCSAPFVRRCFFQDPSSIAVGRNDNLLKPELWRPMHGRNAQLALRGMRVLRIHGITLGLMGNTKSRERLSLRWGCLER